MEETKLSQSNFEIDKWVRRIFKTIDAKDSVGFADLFCEDGNFVFGSFPEARGKQAIHDFAESFYSTLKGLHHKLVQTNSGGGLFYIHFEVTYEVQDGRKVTVIGLETVKMNGNLIEEYIIYMDPTPLLILQQDN